MENKTKILIGIGILAVVVLAAVFYPKQCGINDTCIGVVDIITNCPKGIECIVPLHYCYGVCFASGEQDAQTTAKEQSCVNSGGVISTAMCCENVEDFPDTCLIGACGCAPEYSHEIKTCDCGQDRCFNGNYKCVTNNFI